MLRFHPIANAKAAESYYSHTDSGLYYAEGELRLESIGRGAERLGLSGTPDFEQFKRLIHSHRPARRAAPPPSSSRTGFQAGT